jgi:hypothetical protein
MNNDIFFINTPVEIQEEFYSYIEENLSAYDIPADKTIYLRFNTAMNVQGKYYFQVYLTKGVVEHSILNYPADFLIFLK